MNILVRIIRIIIRQEALLTAILNALNILVEQQKHDRNFDRHDEKEEWIDSTDVKNILHISTSTLYRQKKKKQLTHARFGGRDYYLASEVRNSIRKFMK